MNCWDCGKPIDAQDHFCRYCGQGQGANIVWYYRGWGIVLLTVFGLGPFSLYLVWKSPTLSLASRLALALFVFAFTAYIGYSFMIAMNTLKTALAGAL